MADDTFKPNLMTRKGTAPAGMSGREADRKGYQFFVGGKCKRGHDGRRYASSGECVECCVARAIKRHKDDPQTHAEQVKVYRERHPEETQAWLQEYLARPEIREKRRNWTRRWQAANPQKVKDACHNWRIEHLDYDQERKRQWLRDNPVAAREAVRRRRARLKGAEGSHTTDEILALLEAQSGICAGPGCGVDIMETWTYDHKTPLVRGGSDDISNGQLLCKPCNSSKNDRTMEEWTGRRIAT